MDTPVEDEKPPNGRVVGKEYGVAGKAQLERKKAEREAVGLNDLPSGATEPE